MAYTLEGKLLEVCDCKTLCPCWVGDDPDNGTCKGTLAWHFDKGNIDGVDVSGLTFAALCDIPGNILKGNWRVICVVDKKAKKAQADDAFRHGLHDDPRLAGVRRKSAEVQGEFADARDQRRSDGPQRRSGHIPLRQLTASAARGHREERRDVAIP